MNPIQTIIIGGFALNQRPLATLIQQIKNYSFIDINSFTAPFTLEELTQQLTTQFKQQYTSLQIIAYSCGGLLALKLAELMPQQIKSIILINSTPYFMKQDNWQGIAIEDLQLLEQRLEKTPVKNFLNYFTQLIAQPVKLPQKELHTWHSPACNQAGLSQWLEIIGKTDLRKLVPQLTPKLIWFNAEYDQLILYPKQNSQAHILSASSHLEIDSQQLIAQIEPYL